MDEAQRESDAELTWRAAELATAWVSADTRLTESQGWTLVGFHYVGSAQEEMYVWDRVLGWERALAEVLAGEDGTEESRQRIGAARLTATERMRDMMLEGIPKGGPAHRGWKYGRMPDPREALRRFITSHDTAAAG
ncbi:hypothetical protein [Streptomyces sp. NPDC089799]|uniref:hypothetical protein n=1 Tax=Streptomyces sp. NPDC089799 TaxID=3155066 RepID=UPI003431CA70